MYSDLIQEAAALWESLSQNHAFLRVNGYRLEFNDLDAFSFLMDLYETGRMRFEELDRWLRRNAVAVNPPA